MCVRIARLLYHRVCRPTHRAHIGTSDVYRSMKPKRAGFRAQPSTHRLSVAPSGRAKCRVCKGLVAKGEVRLETCAFVCPGRRTVFMTHALCVTKAQVKDIMSVYGSVVRVPVEVGADAERVHEVQSRMAGLV